MAQNNINRNPESETAPEHLSHAGESSKTAHHPGRAAQVDPDPEQNNGMINPLVSARTKTAAMVLMLAGLAAAFYLGASHDLGRFAGIGLAFFCGGLAIWRVYADDLQKSASDLAARNAEIAHLKSRCETLEDRTWELGESDELQASILSTLGDVVIRRDQKGVVTYINPVASSVFGEAEAPQTGQMLDLPPTAPTAPDSAVPAGESMGFGDLLLKTARGPRWFSRVDIDVRDPSTNEPLVQTVMRDVTERRLIEEDLLAARKSAENSSEEKSRFLAMVSHEIRTPLNGILGMAALLRDTRLTKEQDAYVDALATSGETLLLLINEVLDFSKVEAGKLEIHPAPVRFSPLVESVVELLAPKAHSKGLEFACRVDPCIPEQVTLDPTRTRQILFNLTGNGVKFTEEGGVSVEVSGEENPAGGSILRINVCDTGIGFDKAEAERLFQEFEQAENGTARKFGGTGLGLAIARRLAHLMGGSIRAEPVSEGGARFIVTLPIPENLEATGALNTRTLADRKVAIIGSSRIESTALGEVLRSSGAHTARYAPGDPELADALAHADLLLVENGALSDSGGWLATARLAGCTAPAVVLISPPERDRLEQLREAGYAAYLIRPVRQSSLIQILSGLLDTDSNLEPWDVSGEPQSSGFSADKILVPARPLKLLVAEDNDINRLLCEAMLNKLGHVPTMVVDGDKAVEAAREGSFDAILMDLHMPGCDGVQAIEAIRREETASGRPQTPVLIVTADVMDEARKKAKEAGASGYLTKPLSVEELSTALNTLNRRKTDEYAA